MTDEELQTAQRDLSKQRRDLKEQQGLVSKELDNREMARRANKQVDRMSDPEKDALLQVLKPTGIESEEGFSPGQ